MFCRILGLIGAPICIMVMRSGWRACHSAQVRMISVPSVNIIEEIDLTKEPIFTRTDDWFPLGCESESDNESSFSFSDHSLLDELVGDCVLDLFSSSENED